jgi:hypothetical protein
MGFLQIQPATGLATGTFSVISAGPPYFFQKKPF